MAEARAPTHPDASGGAWKAGTSGAREKIRLRSGYDRLMGAREAFILTARELFVLVVLVVMFAWIAWELVRSSRQ